MFGISFGEFLIIIIVAIVIIGPKDLPDIARQIIKIIAHSKRFIENAKTELGSIGKEIGIEDIKNEVAIELSSQKTKIEQDITTIIDIYGNEHHISGVSEIRKDKNKEDIEKEVAKYNHINSNKSSES